MKLKLLILNFSFLILSSCASNRPVATTHTERIEERVMPIPVGADTIEIELCRDTRLECPNEQSEKLSTFNLQPSTVNTQNIKTCLLGRDFAQQKQDHYVKEKSSYVFLSKNPTSTASPQCRDTRLERPMTRKGQNPTSTASPTVDCRPLTVDTQDIKTCLLGRDFAQQKQDHYVKEKSSYVFLSKNPTSTVSSVRNTNSVKISSTRGINISRHETDTSTRIRLTLRPDTVFVPYTNHIRSDTIVVPDRVCQQKLNRSNMTNLFLILILIVIIIFFLKNRMTR